MFGDWVGLERSDPLRQDPLLVRTFSCVKPPGRRTSLVFVSSGACGNRARGSDPGEVVELSEKEGATLGESTDMNRFLFRGWEACIGGIGQGPPMRNFQDDLCSTLEMIDPTDEHVFSRFDNPLGLQPPPFRRWARGGCQGGLTIF